MKFYNQILSKSLEITQCTGSDLKVLVSEEFKFPSISEDTYGTILRIPKPTKTREGFALNGIVFQNNELGRTLLMRMAMSTVEHLSVHSVITDFSLYNEWRKGKDPKLAVFVIDLIEDLCVKAYVETGLQGLLRDFAISNAVSYSTITDPQAITSKQTLMQSALLSYFIAGHARYLLPSDIKKDILAILSELQKFERLLIQDNSQSVTEGPRRSDDARNIKTKLAEFIYRRLAKYGSPKQSVYLPYTDRHQKVEEVNEGLIVDLGESVQILADTYRTLGLTLARDKSMQEMIGSSYAQEASNMLYDIAVEENWKEKLIHLYGNLGKNTEFDNIIFPREDFAEYYRSYRKNVGSIKRVLEQVRVLKNTIDSNPNQEVGQIDIQEVIQMLAAKKMNRNVYQRDDYLTKNEAWCVLLDMSNSLKPYASTTREMALCLAEVAKDLIPGKATWGLYGFSNKFTVVKDIGENYNANVKARIGGLDKAGLSYIPDALELGARVVSSAGKDHNYLFMISDGRSTGYPDIEAKLEKTIKSIQRTGITIISVGLGSNGLKAYLRNTSVMAETPSELMSKLAKIYFEYSTV